MAEAHIALSVNMMDPHQDSYAAPVRQKTSPLAKSLTMSSEGSRSTDEELSTIVDSS